MEIPAYWGATFTPTLHHKAEGPTLPENNNISGDFIVVITGAGKGLGYHIAVAYARAGATGITISSRTQPDLEALEKELLKINPNLEILSQVMDVSKPEQVKELAKQVQQKFHGRLDAVISNAGVISKRVHDIDETTGERINIRYPRGVTEDEDFAYVVNVNLLGGYYIAKYLTPILIAASNPSPLKAYIAITSVCANMNNSMMTTMSYNVSKAALNRVVEHIQNDHAADGVVAFAVHPGSSMTSQVDGLSAADAEIMKSYLTDDNGLCGGFLTWLTKEKRDWLGGRFLSAQWDVDELDKKKEEIVSADKLKARLHSTLNPSDSELSTYANDIIRAVKSQYDRPSPQRPLPAQDSWPPLDSTVPDSQEHHPPLDVDSQFRFIDSIPTAASDFINTSASAVPARMSQIDDAATQQLSPSHFDSYIQQSRSARQLQDATRSDVDNEDGVEVDNGNGVAVDNGNGADVDNDNVPDVDSANAQREEDTQFTLHEGDEGHIDIISTLEQRFGGANNHDSDPLATDFSPTQSQSALSQFPESQRFKTPATAGKKRRHTGDVVETPRLPRNPLREQAAQRNSNIMGLSQAFAATQANTSPFVPVPQIDLRSDRPSPNIQLQPQPMIVGTSSPRLRLLPDFQRASTEPASRYVPVQQSQAQRDKQAAAQLQQFLATYEEDLDDPLVDEDTQSRNRRRQFGIDQRAQVALREASSPSKRRKRGSSAIKSSPNLAFTRCSPVPRSSASRVSVPIESSPPSQSDIDTDINSDNVNDSEVETDQGDEPVIMVNRSSQGAIAMDAEDKENLSQTGSQVPETTARLYQITNQSLSLLQESPSMRRSHRYTISSRAILNSSEPIAVANSQPSQPQKQHPTISIVSQFATSQGIEFVPQSPTKSPPRTPEARSPMSKDPSGRDDDARSVSDRVSITAKSSDKAKPTKENFNSTIPETSSNEEDIRENPDQNIGPHNTEETSTNTHFETAVSHVPISVNNEIPSSSSNPCSSPLNTTSVAHKRKRMNEIAAEHSPRKSQSQSQSFNASQALQIETELQDDHSLELSHVLSDGIAINLTSVAGSSPRNKQKEIEVPHDILNRRLLKSPSHHDSSSPLSEPPSELDDSDSLNKPVATPLLPSARIRKPSARALSALKDNARTKIQMPLSRKWDIDVSPPQKRVPVMKAPTPTPILMSKAEASSKTKQKVRKRVKLTKVDQTPHSPANDPGATGHDTTSEQVLEVALAQPLSVTPSTNDEIIVPNMVFACYYGGNVRAYYPGLCLGLSGGESKRFLIKWPGYDAPNDVSEVDEHGIRSFDLRVGDLVKVEKKGFPKVAHVVTGFKDKLTPDILAADASTVTDVRGYKTVLVAPKQRKSLPSKTSPGSVKEVPISDIYLDSNMWGHMKDRPFEFQLETYGKASQRFFTPIQPVSTPSTPTSRSRRTKASGTAPAISTLIPSSSPSGLFANMVFAISYQSIEEWEIRTTALTALVEKNGGHILKESWEDLFEPNSLTLKPRFASYKFAALLSDQHSRKPKYMQALALGIPCLSTRWVDACIKARELVDWTFYLLPAGESSELNEAVRSRILPYLTDPISITVSQMISSRPQIFAGIQAVAVIPKGKLGDKLRPFRFLLQASGAATIKEEAKLEAARELLDSMGGIDQEGGISRVLLVKDTQLESARETMMPDNASKAETDSDKEELTKSTTNSEAPTPALHGGIIVVGKDFIVQSLILGKLVLS
ncbi:hypothetical protein LTR84_011075 [Exophiala bonariae]|uniref:BRCT domain-containing protein n=1 Tax=Exophiala bonariae TaxID=1690606 RepID=A0AAV9NLX6_9EURO|nr:hypothetical protein LTR84_011075 [Exophiala bonariae]